MSPQRHRGDRSAHRGSEGRQKRDVRRQRGAVFGRSVIKRRFSATRADAACLVLQIRPEQVCTPTDPGPVFVIVESPSEEFVEAVCTNQQLRRWLRLDSLNLAKISDRISVVI